MRNLSVSHAGTECQKLQDEGRVHINRKWGLLEVASTFQMMENLKQKQQFFFWLYSCQFAQHADSTCHIPCGAVSLTDFLLCRFPQMLVVGIATPACWTGAAPTKIHSCWPKCSVAVIVDAAGLMGPSLKCAPFVEQVQSFTWLKYCDLCGIVI